MEDDQTETEEEDGYINEDDIINLWTEKKLNETSEVQETIVTQPDDVKDDPKVDENEDIWDQIRVDEEDAVERHDSDDEMVTQPEARHFNMARIRINKKGKGGGSNEPPTKKIKGSDGQAWEIPVGKKRITIYESESSSEDEDNISTEGEIEPKKESVKYNTSMRQLKSDDSYDSLFDESVEPTELESIQWKVEKCPDGKVIEIPEFLYRENLQEFATELQKEPRAETPFAGDQYGGNEDASSDTREEPTERPEVRVVNMMRRETANADMDIEVSKHEAAMFTDDEFSNLLNACEEYDGAKIDKEDKKPAAKKICSTRKTRAVAPKEPDSDGVIRDDNGSWYDEESRQEFARTIAGIHDEDDDEAGDPTEILGAKREAYTVSTMTTVRPAPGPSNSKFIKEGALSGEVPPRKFNVKVTIEEPTPVTYDHALGFQAPKKKTNNDIKFMLIQFSIDEKGNDTFVIKLYPDSKAKATYPEYVTVETARKLDEERLARVAIQNPYTLVYKEFEWVLERYYNPTVKEINHMEMVKTWGTDYGYVYWTSSEGDYKERTIDDFTKIDPARLLDFSVRHRIKVMIGKAYKFFGEREMQALYGENALYYMRNTIRVKRKYDESKVFHNFKATKASQRAIVDGGADTVGIGGDAWIIDEDTGRTANVAGFDNKILMEENRIVTAITATEDIDGNTVLLRAHEATEFQKGANSLLSCTQLRENGVEVNDIAKKHGGKSNIVLDGTIIPLYLEQGIMIMKIRKPSQKELTECEMLDLTSDLEWRPSDVYDNEEGEATNTMNGMTQIEQVVNAFNAQKKSANSLTVKKQVPKWERFKSHLLYAPDDVLEQTFKNTTQLGKISMRLPMRRHIKSRNPLLNTRRIMEEYATDTWYATVTSYEGFNAAQVFYGTKSGCISQYGLVSEGQGPDALLDFFRQEGVPISIRADNSKMQTSKLWNEYMRCYACKSQFIEPYNPQQNPAERALGRHKDTMERVLIASGCDQRAWFKLSQHVAYVENRLAKETKGWRTSVELRDGETPDISALLNFTFWEPVYYIEPVSVTGKFPNTKEKLGRWLGIASDYGDGMAYWILTDDTEELIVRSLVRSALKTKVPNKTLPTVETVKDEEKEETKTRKKLPIIEKKEIKIIKDDGSETGEDLGTRAPVYVDPEDLIDKEI
jgi:hypothetical protein